jgi:hypothetical protein
MALQTLPPHHTPEIAPKPAAKAMNPANQKIMATASTPRRINLLEAAGKKRGDSRMKGRAINRVKTPAKIKKLTSEGETLVMVWLLNQAATAKGS